MMSAWESRLEKEDLWGLYALAETGVVLDRATE